MINQQTLNLLSAIRKELVRYSSHSSVINLSGIHSEYSFRTADGKEAAGKINAKFAAGLRDDLVKAVKNQSPIVVDSDTLELSGDGSIFTLSVKAKTEPITKVCNVIPLRPSIAQENSLEANRPTILIVEDNSTFSVVLKRFLERAGFAVMHVENGQRALEYLTAHALPALLISDLHMPEMSGDVLLKTLRSEAQYNELAIVMLSSETDPVIELRLLENGADLFFTKSRDPRLLCAYIKRLVERGARLKVAV